MAEYFADAPIALSILLFLVGAFGGVWNAVAGGATLFTFPALMAVGLPPIVANATNYVAILPSNAAALPAYWKELKSVGRAIWPLLIVSCIGGVAGSLLLLATAEAVFITLVPFFILIATLFFAFGDRIRGLIIANTSGRSADVTMYAALFVASIYGGYFGAGLGIILLGIIQVMGFSSFHVANSIKNLLATILTALGIVIFGAGGLIDWPAALAMMLGAAVGGYAGARIARGFDDRILRRIVIVFGLILSAVYFWRNFA